MLAHLTTVNQKTESQSSHMSNTPSSAPRLHSQPPNAKRKQTLNSPRAHPRERLRNVLLVLTSSTKNPYLASIASPTVSHNCHIFIDEPVSFSHGFLDKNVMFGKMETS